MEDAIRYEINDQIERIILDTEDMDTEEIDEAVNNNLHDIPDGSINVEIFENAINYFFYGSQNGSNEDDIDENTDTDDGANDGVNLDNTSQEILEKLNKQSQTIARLRVRIERLNEKMGILTKDTDQTYQEEHQQAMVLMDTQADMSLTFLKPKPDSDIKMGFLDNLKIKNEIAIKLAKIGANKGQNKPALWMYFDSGASRSVISTTSPVRKYRNYGSYLCNVVDIPVVKYACIAFLNMCV
jgi:hypothetical protein